MSSLRHWMLRKLVPEVVNTSVLITVDLGASARDAAGAMATHRVSAVLVMDGKRLKGIVTERDITWRVVAAGLSAHETRVEGIMTPEPATLGPDAPAQAAIDLMRMQGFRHLPIVDDDRVVAMVSMRDLYEALQNCAPAEEGLAGVAAQGDVPS